MPYKRHISTVFMLLVGVFAASMLTPETSLGQFRVDVTEGSLTQLVQRSWQSDDGLPQNTIAAIEQTDDGYMWFGTEEGLVRFNGLDFAVFDDANVPAFASNQSVRALEVRMDGTLWIGTDGGGLVIYERGSFFPALGADGAGPEQVTSLYEDRAGTLWIGTFEDGLWMIRAGQKTTRRVFGSKTVRGLSEDSIGNLYAGTPEGVIRVSPEGVAEPFGRRFDQSTALQNVFVDRLDRIWFSTREGTYRMDDPNVVRDIATVPAPSFLQDSRGRIWIGLDGEGLLRIGDTQESLTTADGLTHGRVVSLHEDREGSVWVGTEGGGVVQLSQGEFVTYGVREGLLSEMVLAVEVATDGSIWAGTEGGGLYRFDGANLRHYGLEDGLSDDKITSLAADDGTMWVGTFFGGLNRVDRRGVVHIGKEEGLPGGVVSAVEVAKDGSVWVGTDGGLSRIKDSKITTFTTDDGLGSNYLIAIKEDRQGILWIGTYAGLFFYDGNRIHPAETQPDKTILSITEDSDGLLWVSTLHNGVHIKDDGTWYHFARRHGLPSNSVYQTVFDNEGLVWFSSNSGLMAGSRADILQAVHADSTVAMLTKTVSDGLRSTEFNGGFQPAGVVDNSGRLWFPSIRGLASIMPAYGQRTQNGPPIAIEAIDINGSPAEGSFIGNQLSLEPGQRKIEIRAAAITFRSPEKVWIEYLLDGQDDGWNRVAAGQRITYTNLAPGLSTLRLRTATYEGGVRLGPESTISIKLRPFMYQTPAFWAVLIGAIGLLIFGIHRFQVKAVTRRERLKNLELERTVVQRTRELKQLNDHLAEKVETQVRILMSERTKYEHKLIGARDRALESDRLKSTIISNLGHEFRTPITSILGFTDILSENLSDEDLEFASYIKHGAQRLLDTLTSLIDLSELEAKAIRHNSVPVSACGVAADAASAFERIASDKGLRLQTICPPNPIVATVDPQLLHKAVTAVVNNAVKYTDSGEVSIAISEADEFLVVTITDTGIGISEDFIPEVFSAFSQESIGENRNYEGCGLGLTVAHRLVDLMDGSIEVHSTQNVGSTFTIRLPLNPTHSPASSTEEARPRPAPAERSATSRLSSGPKPYASTDALFRNSRST